MIFAAVEVETRASTGRRLIPRAWARFALPPAGGIVLACLTALPVCVQARGAANAGGTIPPAPEDHVLDTTRLFDNAPDLRGELSKALREAWEESRFEVYVAAYSHLPPGESPDERAARLVRAWTRGEEGLVLLYVRSTNQLTFGSPTGMVDSLTLPVCRSIYGKAVEEARNASNPPRRVQMAALIAIREARAALQSLQGGRRRLAGDTAIGVSAILAACLGLYVLGRLFTRVEESLEARANHAYFFPNVRVGPSLGGKFGGGVFAELDCGRAGAPVTPPGRDSD